MPLDKDLFHICRRRCILKKGLLTSFINKQINKQDRPRTSNPAIKKKNCQSKRGSAYVSRKIKSDLWYEDVFFLHTI